MSSGSVGLVVDTNVWLDALLFDDPNIAWFYSQHVIFACESQRSELAITLTRPNLVRPEKNLQSMLAAFDQRVCLQANPTFVCPLQCKDKDDQKFLELAWHNPPSILLSKAKNYWN